MNIVIAIVVILASAAIGALGFALFVVQRRQRKELRKLGIIMLSWGMRIQIPCFPGETRKAYLERMARTA